MPTGSSRTPDRPGAYVYPKHVLDVEDGKAAHDAFLLNPVGTGPYKVESFSPNDQVIYVDQRELPRAKQALLRQRSI